MRLSYNPSEEEAIILKAAWDHLDGCVNYALFGKFQYPTDVTLYPHTSNDRRLFNILVADFLSTPKDGTLGLKGVPSDAKGSVQTFLSYLLRVVAAPKLRPGGERLIAEPVERFATWLDGQFTVEKVWLANVEIEIELTLTRLDMIKICGNISKHNFSRLDADVGRIRRIMKTNGREVTEEEAYLLIPDFYAWFHENIFAYHTSHIAEMLNAILWGIYDYLFPEFERAFTPENYPQGHHLFGMYHYDVPPEFGEGLSRTMYWDLMNEMRRKPSVERFKAHWSLKERY